MRKGQVNVLWQKMIKFAARMNKFFLFSFAFLVLLLFTTGCSEYNKALKSDDYKVKYEAAVKYYNNDECF